MRLTTLLLILTPFIACQSDFDDQPLTTIRQQVTVRRMILDNTHPALAYDSPLLYPSPSDPSSSSRQITPLEASSTISNQLTDVLTPFSDFYKQPFITQVSTLPDSSFLVPSPWTNDYWATYKDGINVAWGDPQSASEKYAIAFGLDTDAVMNGVSAYNGIDSVNGLRPNCTTQDTCDALNDSSVCGIRVGQVSGYCIPSWYGIVSLPIPLLLKCHAWTPAAILETEPKCNVTQNGITFNVMDIKALLTFLYDRTGVETLFGANRCYDNTTLLGDSGRIKTPECRDMTPDFFHVMLTNIIGRFKRSFVMDVDATSQVWNQPMRGYAVLEKGEVSGATAAGLIDPSLTKYPFNDLAMKFMYFKTRYEYINEALSLYPLSGETDDATVSRFTKDVVVEYILELDAFGGIIGGEWLNDSKTLHPDFMWIPTNGPLGNTTVAGINFDNVKQLLKSSLAGDC